LPPLHADRPKLNRDDIAVPIDDQPGQPVPLGVDRAKAGRIGRWQAQRRPKLESLGDPRSEEIAVEARRRVPRQQAHGDRRPR
jgi:hypothetical protein